MKRILTILFLLASAATFGQKHVYFGPPNTIDSFNLTMWVRQFKMPTAPLISPFWDSAGSVYLNVPQETIYFHNGLVWQPIAGGGGGGGLQHPGPWLIQRGDTVDLDSAGRVAYTLAGATDLRLPTAKAVSDALADVAPLDTLPYYAKTTALADSMGIVRDSLAAIRGDIPVDYIDSARLADTASAIRGAIPSTSGFVPYTGATANVNLGNNSITAASGVINHASGSGTALSVTKGGAGIGLFVNKTSGSGNAMEVQGGVTLLETLHLTNALQDAYISSAATWNAKQNFSDTTTWDATRSWVNGRIPDTTSLSNRINLKLNASDTASNVVTNTSFRTITNKRWVPRVISSASYTTSVTIPADSVDLFQITAQAGALLFNAPSGTPNNGDLLVIRIKDNGTARALTYNAIFNWSPPSTTVLGKYLVMCFMYNSVTSNWNFMWKRDEP
jgi:hypothetical protein